MTKKEIANQIVVSANGIARTADFVVAGLSKQDICALNNEGFLRRVRHGFYQLADDDNIFEEQLLASLLPEGIVCVESALFHYNYSDFAPRIWSIAVPRTISRAKLKIDTLNFKPYYIQKEFHTIGRTTSSFNGVTLSVYDRERTVCDCFKYRTRLDSETFNKAIHAYVADEHKKLNNLSKYAKQLGLFNKVSELMEVLLNG